MEGSTEFYEVYGQRGCRSLVVRHFMVQSCRLRLFSLSKESTTLREPRSPVPLLLTFLFTTVGMKLYHQGKLKISEWAIRDLKTFLRNSLHSFIVKRNPIGKGKGTSKVFIQSRPLLGNRNLIHF